MGLVPEHHARHDAGELFGSGDGLGLLLATVPRLRATPSPRRNYMDNVASMAWGARNKYVLIFIP